MKSISIIFLTLFLAMSVSVFGQGQSTQKRDKVQVALLLDVSGSMDGLLDQAKEQLWKMVNELALAKRNGKTPDIEIALFEFGRDSNDPQQGYVKQLVPLTRDLDRVSEALFAINTNGGSEYCGWVVQSAAQQLKWSDSNEDYKVMIIAGNEAFTQGSVDYKESCKAAISKGIIVNTIFCGNCQNGIDLNWKDGADRADGQYMCINQNATTVHIDSPYDDEILKLNSKLNSTYIGYGSAGRANIIRQEEQDKKARSFNKSNMLSRAKSKSSAAYSNSSWDLVDAEEDEAVLEEIFEAPVEERKAILPKELQGKSKKEVKEIIEKKSKERKEIQARIDVLSSKRSQFVMEKQKEMQGEEANTLDAATLKIIRTQATSKGFSFKK